MFLFRKVNMAALRWLMAVARQWMLLLCPEKHNSDKNDLGHIEDFFRNPAINAGFDSIFHWGSKVKSMPSKLMENKGK